jgi:hypothetical protein
MNKIWMPFVSMMAILFLGIGLGMTDAMAQKASSISKAKLVGTWSLIAVNNTSPDGKTAVSFDQNDGMIIFEPNGRFIQALIRSDLPKIATNNRATGTPDENKAIVQGTQESVFLLTKPSGKSAYFACPGDRR